MEDILQRTRQYVATTFPGLEPEPAIVETCIYTVRNRWTTEERHSEPSGGPFEWNRVAELVRAQFRAAVRIARERGIVSVVML